MTSLAFLGIFHNPRTFGERAWCWEMDSGSCTYIPLHIVNLDFSYKGSLTVRTVYLILQERKNKATTTEEELAREVDRLKAKVEAGRACYIEKYKECQRLHKQIRQLRASTMVGGRVRGPGK